MTENTLWLFAVGAVVVGQCLGLTEPSQRSRLDATIETQHLLMAVGFFEGPVSGEFGEAPQRALRNFQIYQNLPRDLTPRSTVLDELRRIAGLAPQPEPAHLPDAGAPAARVVLPDAEIIRI